MAGIPGLDLKIATEQTQAGTFTSGASAANYAPPDMPMSSRFPWVAVGVSVLGVSAIGFILYKMRRR